MRVGNHGPFLVERADHMQRNELPTTSRAHKLINWEDLLLEVMEQQKTRKRN